MGKQPTNTMRACAAIIALAAWAAVLLQFYLILLNRTASVAETVMRFFSFFTILTNILVALCCTVVWRRARQPLDDGTVGGDPGLAGRRSVALGSAENSGRTLGSTGNSGRTLGSAGNSGRVGNFFLRPATLTAITVYITIVSLTYNLVLRTYWEPQGLQLWVDELLHSVIPCLFVIFWLVFVPKGGLHWKDVGSWMIYPIAYVLFIIVRGALSGFYPYPFIDVNKIAYSEALLNAGMVLIGFGVVSLLLVGIGKIRS